jgi:hypothetical protein
MCLYSVDVTGISLTSENLRDAVFVEARAPDHAKWRLVSAYVDALFARLSVLPVQTIRVGSTYRGFDYVLAVIDPKDGRKYLVEGQRETERESLRLAKTKKLGIEDVSQNLPFALSGLNGASNPGECLPMQKQGVAKLQLFDDGWRVIEIKGEFKWQVGYGGCLEAR